MSVNTVLRPESGAEIGLNRDWAEQAFSSEDREIPFSFVYGGQHSSEFIGGWERTDEDEILDAIQRRHVLTLTDPQTGLKVCAVATIYTDTPGVDWTLSFANAGTEATPILEHVKALDVTLERGEHDCVTLHQLRGSDNASDDWLPFDERLSPGERIELAPILGRSSNGACPFFNLEWDGGGVITAIGWTGQWTASIEHTEDARLRIQAGMEKMHVSLRPGETIRSLRILQLYWEGNDTLRAYNLFRQTMLSHVVPKVGGETIVPPIVHLSTSFCELNDSTEANVLSHLEPIKELGFEFFWLDAYFTRGGFPDGMGNYGFPLELAIPSDRFPNGLKPISDAAHAAGMGFLVWFEPERVADGTYIAREHPEWIISLEDQRFNLLNIGLPEARTALTDYLIAAIHEYGMDCLRIDYNIDPLPFWRSLDQVEPDRVGIAEIRYIEALYQMWDDILAAHPHLFIDNCSSGGRRIDIETCSRSIPLWRTDATIAPLMESDFDQSALQNQVMTAGLSRYVPFNVSGQMGPAPYWFRSGFNAGIPVCDDCRAAGYPLDLLKAGIEEGKRIRKYYFGNFYPLNEVTTSPGDWCVLQYHRPDEQDGMVIAFRRPQSSDASFVFSLHEIDPDAKYEITQSHGYDPSDPLELAGTQLQLLKLEIDDCPGSVVVEYKRAGA